MIKIEIPLRSIFLASGLFTSFGLCFSVVTCCMYTLDCSRGLPTLSYASKFPGHDKLFLFLMSVFSCTHFWIYIAMNSVLREIKTCCSRCVQLAGMCCIPCLLLMTLIDQNISKDIHATFAFLFLGLQLVYVFAIKAILLPSHPLYLSHFKPRLQTLKIWDYIVLVSCVITVIEFYVANLEQNKGSYYHGRIQAISEYILVCGGVMYPWLLSYLLPATSINLYTQPNKDDK